MRHLQQCMRGLTSPLPLLFVPTGSRFSVRACVAIAVGASLALGVVVMVTCLAATAPSFALRFAHLALASLAIAGAVGAIRARLASYGGAAPGVYLFPFDLVDARTSRVRVRPLAGIREIAVRTRDAERGGVAVDIDFADCTTCAIVVGDRATADELRSDIVAALRRIAELDASGDRAHAEAFAAFADVRESSSSVAASDVRAPHPSTISFATAAMWSGAVALGIFAGAVAFGYAKTANDDLRFIHASALGTPEAFETYLTTGGGRYEAEVRDTLLPCVELRDVLAQSQSLTAYAPLATFVQKYPKSYCTAAARGVLTAKIDGVRVAFEQR